jgi:hypothetical protein
MVEAFVLMHYGIATYAQAHTNTDIHLFQIQEKSVFGTSIHMDTKHAQWRSQLCITSKLEGKRCVQLKAVQL